MVLQFPAWYEFPRSGPLERYADIGDLVTSFYTFRTFAARAIQQGILPLWNPHILLGAPFLANSQSALFYPQHLLFYVLPLPLAWTASILISMFLAATFMALLMRSIGSSKTGAILSGILFASCGFMTAWQGQAMYEAAIWLPLICYTVHRLHIKPSPTMLALTSLAFAMPVLAGHPETAAHLTLAGMFMALILWLSPDNLAGRAFDLRFLLAFTIAGVSGAGACFDSVDSNFGMARTTGLGSAAILAHIASTSRACPCFKRCFQQPELRGNPSARRRSIRGNVHPPGCGAGSLLQSQTIRCLFWAADAYCLVYRVQYRTDTLDCESHPFS